MAHRLLLADDSVTIQKVIELTFADEDVKVVAVGDGDQALARLAIDPYDIVLADVGMPGKTGFEVAAHVRDMPPGRRMPVILLTGAFDPVDDAKVAEVGAAAVLSKPFEPQVLVAKVKSLLNAAKASSAAAPAGASGSHAAAGGRSAADALLAAPSAGETEAPSVDDYFERLDRAFANLNAQGDARDAAPVARNPSRPVPVAVEAPPRIPVLATAQEELASRNAPPVAREAAGQESGPHRAAAPAQAAAPVPQSEGAGLGDTFSRLLAVEQGELPASALAPPSQSAEDELVDRIARKVVEQLADRAVREIAADIVSRTAERLVREEIARLKSGLAPGH